MGASIFMILLIPLYIIIPSLILYFVIRFAIIHAIRELKNEGTL